MKIDSSGERGNNRSRETCLEATAARQVRVGEGLARMVTVGVMRSWLDSGYMFEGILIQFAKGMAVECERKRGVKDNCLKAGATIS